jgi:multidrug efflux pump subunit AcrA (membrane-fusion protein)
MGLINGQWGMVDEDAQGLAKVLHLTGDHYRAAIVLGTGEVDPVNVPVAGCWWVARAAARHTAECVLNAAISVGVTKAQYELLRQMAAEVAEDCGMTKEQYEEKRRTLTEQKAQVVSEIQQLDERWQQEHTRRTITLQLTKQQEEDLRRTMSYWGTLPRLMKEGALASWVYPSIAESFFEVWRQLTTQKQEEK